MDNVPSTKVTRRYVRVNIFVVKGSNYYIFCVCTCVRASIAIFIQHEKRIHRNMSSVACLPLL